MHLEFYDSTGTLILQAGSGRKKVTTISTKEMKLDSDERLIGVKFKNRVDGDSINGVYNVQFILGHLDG